MKLSNICSQCGKMSKNMSTCMFCGGLVGECCFVSSHGICKICATKSRTMGRDVKE